MLRFSHYQQVRVKTKLNVKQSSYEISLTELSDVREESYSLLKLSD